MVQQKIIQYLDFKGISKYKFYQETGLSNGFLNKIGSIGTDKCEIICSIYPEINPTWLLTGKGPMLLGIDGEVAAEISENKAIGKKVSTKYELPLVSVEALAGVGRGDMPAMEYESEMYSVPLFKGRADFLIGVAGSSMIPKYYAGDILACKRINEINFIQWGKVYVLDTEQGVIVKRLYQTDEDEKVLCFSENKEMYPQFTIPKTSIRSLSLVVGTIKVE